MRKRCTQNYDFPVDRNMDSKQRKVRQSDRQRLADIELRQSKPIKVIDGLDLYFSYSHKRER
jgi:hypothetical protein